MTSAQRDESIDQLLSGTYIPSPPQVVADLHMLMSTDDPDINAMSKLISQDIGLSGAVLKVVNSPYYGGRGSISSISQAIIHLGLKTVVEIVTTHCLKESCMTGDMPPSIYEKLIHFWDSATDLAHVCNLVARALKISPLERVYTLGLFQNAGITLLAARNHDYFDILQQAYQDREQDIETTENALTGTSHAIVGYYVAKAWGLEEKVCNIIGLHHSPDVFTNHSLQHNIDMTLLSVLKISEHIIGLHSKLGNCDEDHEWARIETHVLEFADITKSDLEDLIEHASDEGYVTPGYIL